MNGLPEVRAFIHNDADLYENLRVNFIKGHNPELFIFDDDDNEIEKIELAKYSTQEIHDLLVSKGFKRGPPKAESATRSDEDGDDDDDNLESVEYKEDIDDADL